jgi:hypothetical protein
MNRDEIRALLLRIVQETGYRELLIADPVYALAQAGITFDPAYLPAGGVKLPPNADIESTLEDLTTAVEVGKSHITVLLSLGET